MVIEVSGYQVETCSGLRGCPNRAIICEGLAEEIRQRLIKQDLKSFLKKIVRGPIKIHHEFRISISDCPNACSRPQIADIGLIGACRPVVTGEMCNGCGSCVETCREDAISVTGDIPFMDGEKCLSCGKCIAVCPTGTLQTGRSGYRILLGGKLGRHPCLGTELPGIFNKDQTLEIIDRCVEYYKTHCVEGERLGEIMGKNGVENILQPVYHRP
ncbi:MAG: hypothetical protein ACD_75C00718G0001 [uncultured bacterium]|nr:MAG: hypothetical protein ACD_75C00718G0001 [uncultured bacterium]OHE30147.1 MAG: hypothetical protein A3J94_08705 [Syntrophus sp. RIFOXYC2_FULL_54_9]HBB18747.1 sulfite reductase [Syntrophus sp. (in: bacteria)]